MILGDGTEVRMGNTYGQGEVGDKRGSKEMDRCPLTALANAIPLRKVLPNVLSSSLSPTNAPLELTSRWPFFDIVLFMEVLPDEMLECLR
jgi:hypothetical protein